MRRALPVLVAAAVLGLGAVSAEASAVYVDGYVACDASQDHCLNVGDAPLAGVRVIVTGSGGDIYGFTDANGYYHIPLPLEIGSYVITLDPATLPEGATILQPQGGSASFDINAEHCTKTLHWLVECDGEGTCWMTGGGAKFSPITSIGMAEKGPQHSFGGNVNPSCSPYPGQGGQWNHIAHGEKLHFMGTAIQVVRCGNVGEIPDGSESPVTPFNFIEFEGTGTLKGIKGNKDDFGIVSFFARVEDRNEPGSSGAKAGTLIDRYYLHVFVTSDTSETTLLLVDGDGVAATVDPVLITHGNLQLHISSCSPQ